MHFTLYLMFLYCCFLSLTSAEKCECDCFPVSTVDVKLEELIKVTPFYLQAGGKGQGLAMNLDSVCLDLNCSEVPENAFVKMNSIYFDGKPTLRRASIQVPINDSIGTFLAAGPTRTYKDFYLGKCDNIYVVYRCPQTGDCVTNKTLADVVVYSTSIVADQESIDRGIAIAKIDFPEVDFYIPPRKTCAPCDLN